jgi:hypothetical protein
MMPSMNPNDPPPFHSLGERAFEELCRDLFERELGIRICEMYGVRGQTQMGIDLMAQARDWVREVGQCKCCVRFPPAEIRKASDKFLRNLEYWRDRNIKRFILFVATPLENKNQLDEIDKQIKRFADEGILYEAWSARTLRTKLRPYPDLVRRYTNSEEWVRMICGSKSEGDEKSEGRNGRTVESEIEQISLFKKLFGFEAKLPLRKAVVNFYNASHNISRSSIKHASEYLTEEGEKLKVAIPKISHGVNILLAALCVFFFVSAVVLSPVLHDQAGPHLAAQLLLYSTASMGAAMWMFWMFNGYVQALRIRRELGRLRLVS